MSRLPLPKTSTRAVPTSGVVYKKELFRPPPFVPPLAINVELPAVELSRPSTNPPPAPLTVPPLLMNRPCLRSSCRTKMPSYTPRPFSEVDVVPLQSLKMVPFPAKPRFVPPCS